MAKEESIKKELQRTKEDLEDLAAYMEEFFAFLPIPVCTVNPQEIIIDANKNLFALSEYTSIEIIGEPLETIFLEKEKVKRILDETLKKGVAIGRELTLVSKSKKEIPVSVSFSGRKDREGNSIGYFLSVSDITEFKKLQEEMEEKVKERTKELNEKVEELEKFNRLAVGRELKMIELKAEIEKLKEELEKVKGRQ